MKSTKSGIFTGMALLLTSCGSSEPFQLPDNIYTISKVYDIANNSNASDIRVEIALAAGTNLANLSETRLVIVKGSKTFTKEQIKSLVTQNYSTITISSDPRQVVKPIASMRDSDGDLIGNGSYKAYVAIIGIKNSLQLSGEKEFVLSNKPIYGGDYVGTWEDLGPPGPAKFPMSMRLSEDYSGEMYYANSNFTPFGSGSQDASVTMIVNGTTITSFVLDQFVGGYKGGCLAKKTLGGHFEDDITLVLDTFTWADCDGTREVVLKFIRQ